MAKRNKDTQQLRPVGNFSPEEVDTLTKLRENRLHEEAMQTAREDFAGWLFDRNKIGQGDTEADLENPLLVSELLRRKQTP